LGWTKTALIERLTSWQVRTPKAIDNPQQVALRQRGGGKASVSSWNTIGLLFRLKIYFEQLL
jgi:hypothetical protein